MKTVILIFFINFIFSQIWSPPQKISLDTLEDLRQFYPDVYARDSIIWVTWYSLSRQESCWIYFATYYDFGRWHRPKVVSVESIRSYPLFPVVAIDTNYIPYVLFTSGRAENPKGNLYWTRYEGGEWLPLQPVFRDRHWNFFCEAICDKRGRIWAIWQRDTTLLRGIWSSYYDGNNWSDLIFVSELPPIDEPQIPMATLGKDGKIWIVYYKSLSFFSSNTYDTSWSEDDTIIFIHFLTTIFPGICCDSNGTIWAVTSVNNKLVVFRNYGFGWLERETISERRLDIENYDPSLCCDKEGVIWVVWWTNEGKILSRYYRNRRWSSISQVNPDTFYFNLFPRVIYSHKKIWVIWCYNNHIYAAWADLLGIEEEKIKKKKPSITKPKIFNVYGSLIRRKNLRKGIYFKRTEKGIEKIVILK